jgi:imidazolonepropionase-like amidohydrolase
MRTVVLEAGRLIDATGADAIENAVVVIEGNKIKAVGPAGDFSLPIEGQRPSTLKIAR